MAFIKQQLILLFVLGFLLVSCQSDIELLDNEPNFSVDDERPARPIIDRSQPPMDPPDIVRETTPAPPAPGANQSPVLGPRDNRNFKIPINFSFGNVLSTIGVEQLPLLRPAAIQTGDNHFRGYRQLIHISKGTMKPVFVHDDYRREEYLGDALFFPEDIAYMNFSIIRNNNRPFFDDALVESDIRVAGRTYRVMEASNHSLVLNGVDVEQQLILGHNRSLQSNQKMISQSKVYYRGARANYHVLAQNLGVNGFFLRPNETLKTRVEEPGAFVGDLDMRYDGLEELRGTTIRFRAFDQRIELQWDSSDGRISIPVLGLNNEDQLIHGDIERVHFIECTSREDGCVAPDDLLIMHAATNQETVTRLLRVSSINPDSKTIHLRDVQTREQINLRYEQPNPNAQPYADLSFLGKNYRLFVVNTTTPNPNNMSENISVANRLSVDLTANNQVRGEQTTLHSGPIRVSLDNPLPQDDTLATYVLNISLNTDPFTRNQQQNNQGLLNKEQLLVQAVYENEEFSIRIPEQPREQLWDQRLHQLRDEDDSSGLSLWGSELHVRNGVQETKRDLTITIPYEQRFARVTIGRLE